VTLGAPYFSTSQASSAAGASSPVKRKRGRPPVAVRKSVPHRRRAVDAAVPLHITLRLLPHVAEQRSRRFYEVLEHSIKSSREHFGGSSLRYSLLRDRVHILAESTGPEALGRAMQGLGIRMAKLLNAFMGTKGRVFADRYQVRPLATTAEVRKAIATYFASGKGAQFRTRSRGD